MITGKGIVKTYGENHVLNNVSITIEDGEFVAVMGPSGCGKSTLLFSLSGTDEINGGSIRHNQNELSNLKERELSDLRRQRMGFVFQQPTMLKNLNLLDNIALPALQGKKKDVNAVKAKAMKLLQRTGIGELAQRDVTEVSGGQLQRAGICRALINSPDIVFADEPTGALNSKSSDEIMALFSEVNQEGTAIMMVTHDAKVAACASRVLFMKDGEIVRELSMSNHQERGAHERTEVILTQMKEINI